MRCVVLHQEVAGSAPPDEQDTLATVHAVTVALAARGYAVEQVTLGLDFRPLAAKLTLDPPTFVFNLAENLSGLPFSRPGELAVAAFLEGCGVRFTGSRLVALALSADKPAAKRVLKRAGVPVPEGAEEGWPGPFIVKHATEHASFGLGPHSVTPKLPKKLPAGCFAEAFLPGREFSLSMLEEPAGLRPLPPAELVYAGDWPAGVPRILDYAGKWLPNHPRFIATQRRFDGIDPELTETLGPLARRAFAALGLRGYGRVDIRLDAAGVARVLEVNANPALAPDAGFAAAAAKGGLSYGALIDRIVAAALGCGAIAPHEITPTKNRVHGLLEIRFRRTLCTADAAAVEALVKASGFFSVAERAIAVELAREAERRGDASGYRFLLAERPPGHLIGYACFGPVPGTKSSWDLYWIVVEKAAQGRGIGRKIVEKVARIAALEGGERLCAETSGRSLYAPTRRFYRAMGFSLHAVLADFYAEDDAKQTWVLALERDDRRSEPREETKSVMIGGGDAGGHHA